MMTFSPAPTKVRSPTAVSQALRAIHDDFSFEDVIERWTLGESQRAEDRYQIVIATDRQTRERACKLAYRVYHRCGYVENASGMVETPYDNLPGTCVLLIQDTKGEAIATATVVLDSERGLPSDEIYGPELDEMRRQGRKLSEVVRLAIADEHCHCKQLLISLFNFVYLCAHLVRGADDFVIEVNPRHVAYYQRLLEFTVTGPERPCPRVQNAPAVLLGLDLHKTTDRIAQATTQASPTDRSLFRYSYPLQRQQLAVAFIERSLKRSARFALLS